MDSQRTQDLKYIEEKLKLPNGSYVCPSDLKVLDNVLLLVKRIGSESVNGEVLKTCYKSQCDKNICNCSEEMILATKKIPLRQQDIQMMNYHTSKEAMVVETWVEIMCMKLGVYLVNNRMSKLANVYKVFFL